jgi:hypothetical protein
MASNHSRRAGTLAAALLLVALLGVLAWRWAPMARERMTGAAATTADVDTTRANAASSVSPPRAPRPSIHGTAEVAATADPQQARCSQRRVQQLRLASERLRNPATPEQVIQHALLLQILSLRGAPADPGINARMADLELRAARRRWPDNLELAWFSMHHCSEGLGCDRETEWNRLATLDPDNAAVWMLAMGMALQRHDDDAYGQALRRAAGAKFYDSRIGTTFLHIRPLLAALPRSDECWGQENTAQLTELIGHAPSASDWADIEASMLEFALGMPALAELSGCGPRAPAMSAQRRRDCMALLSRIAEGETLLEQNIALRFLIPLAGNTPEGMALRERYRRLRWLWTQVPRTHMPKDYFSRLWADGEVALLREAAIAQHRWPPPPDWLPDDERSRALIVDGHVPPEQH